MGSYVKIDINRYLDDAIEDPRLFLFDESTVENIVNDEQVTFCDFIKFILSKKYYICTDTDDEHMEQGTTEIDSEFWIPSDYILPITKEEELELLISN